jgi:hypothetical protein
MSMPMPQRTTCSWGTSSTHWYSLGIDVGNHDDAPFETGDVNGTGFQPGPNGELLGAPTLIFP